MPIHYSQELGHRADLPLLAPRLDTEPLLQLRNQPHPIIVAVDMEVAYEVVVRANTVWRNYCDSLKQFVNDIARLSHGAPRL